MKLNSESSCADAVIANEEFIVLIIGAFSSGKSSMINALVGEEFFSTSLRHKISLTVYIMSSQAKIGTDCGIF